MTKRIPADQVVRIAQPALVATGADEGVETITVIPLVDGDAVAGLEVRCRCGAHVVVDCVYDDNATPQQPEASS